jgi:hypothetical protein
MLAHVCISRDDLDYDEVGAMRDSHVSRYWQDEDFHQVSEIRKLTTLSDEKAQTWS